MISIGLYDSGESYEDSNSVQQREDRSDWDRSLSCNLLRPVIKILSLLVPYGSNVIKKNS